MNRIAPRLRLVLGLAVLAFLPLPLAAQVAPDARWQTFDTQHFRVHFAEGLGPLARRAADRAERAHAILSAELVEPPQGTIDLVVADNVDFANGYATPIPRNRIVIYAHPPSDAPSLAYYEDWLEVLILHELVHVFHLDEAGGVWERLRSVVGRSPLLFPEAFSPSWLTEGLATYYESAFTAGGRVRGTNHEMVLRTAILDDEFFTIDRVTGDPITWPGPTSRYIYGSMFIDHLARSYGRDRVRQWVESYGRQLIPFRLDAVARHTLDTSFTAEWRRWDDSLRTRYAALADSLRARGLTEPEILTPHGRSAAFPRYHPAGEGIVYTAATGKEQPALRLIAPDGSIRGIEGVTSLAPVSFLPGGRDLLFAQIDYVDPYRIYSDLYRISLDGAVRRLTRAARIWEADAHPDGRRAVGVASAQGANALILHDLETGETRPLAPGATDVHWSLPRWSPSGDRIAVGRWSAGGLSDVVVLDSTGAVIRELTRDRAVDNAPAWSPDGRYVLFSSDRTGIANLYAYDLRDERLMQVTNLLTGAFQPDVSPDGRWIAFSLYAADGYHIARVPFDPARWRPAPPLRPEAATPGDPLADREGIGGPARRYSALETALPTSWALLLDAGSGLGAGTGVALFGEDVIERHLWAGSILAYAEGPRVEGGGAYQYRGLGNPVLNLFASQNWSEDFAPGELDDPDGDPIESSLLRREREAGASLLWTGQRYRSTRWVGAGGEISQHHREWDDPDAATGLRLRDIPLDLAATLDAGYSTARGFALSLGPQQGVSLGSTLEAHRYAEPFEGETESSGYLRWKGRGRGYAALPLAGWARHVLAFRADAGLESGSRGPGLRAGGTSGGGSVVPGDLELLGDALDFPVRGYGSGVQEGNRAFAATAEYRFPIALIDRGVRVLPLFLSRVWGDAFIDAGGAWCTFDPGECRMRYLNPPTAPRPLVSVGAELVAHLRTGFFVDLPLRLGVALPLRDEGSGKARVYLRVGRSF